MNTQMKTLNSNMCGILFCNLLERIVLYRTQHSGSDDHRHQHQ